MEAFTFNTAELILLSAAGILFIIQLIYYFGLYNRIHVRNKTVRKEETHFSRELPPLSVILCARNEADNLRKILPAILEQDYPQFEVIVINDASTDETEDVLGYNRYGESLYRSGETRNRYQPQETSSDIRYQSQQARLACIYGNQLYACK